MVGKVRCPPSENLKDTFMSTQVQVNPEKQKCHGQDFKKL